MSSKRKTLSTTQRAAKKLRKTQSQKKASGNSAYGRKRAYLVANGGRGTDYPDKPWR